MTIDVVVADANVLLSAVIGKAANKVFTEHDVIVHVAEFNASEVEEYIPRLAKKYGIPDRIASIAWQVLPTIVHPAHDYQDEYDRALADMQERDPEDAHALALSRHLDVPLWSNDKDFSGQVVECYSTAELLSILEGKIPRRIPQ